MKKTIAIDMDGVIADVERHFIDWYEKDYGFRLPREAMQGVAEDNAFPDEQAVRRFLFTKNFFRTIPVMPGAIAAVQKLMENYEVYIASAAMEFPHSLPEKYEWLQEHFPFIGWRHLIFCGDKSIIHTDYLIDDHCKNLDVHKGKALLFSSGHNAWITHHQRVDNWAAVLEFFKKEQTGK